jgi:hypothetical protein
MKNPFFDEILENSLRQTHFLNQIHFVILSKEFDDLDAEEKLKRINALLYEWRWPWSAQKLSGSTSSI